MREIILDTETTGLSPKDGHRIIEIGCVELVDKVVTGNNYHAYINPQILVSEAAFNVHGLSNEFLEDKPIFKDVIDDFVEFIGNDDLVIHNANFDMGFLNHEFKLQNKKPLLNQITDTLKLARSKYPGSKVNLDALCKKLNVSNSARDKHGALLDAEILAHVYIKMVSGDQSALSFVELDENSSEEKFFVNKLKFPHRIFDLSDEDCKMHESLISNLNDPMWKKID
jgi:DNA polymerase-3 subunit epsilon